MPSRENCLASVPPDRQYGTARPPGSKCSTASRIAAYTGPSTGAVSGTSRWWYSQRTSGPVSRSIVRTNSSSPPGTTRPSTCAVALPGMTFTL